MNNKEGLPTGRQGKFIVLYGINNLGKTTQAEMLVQKFKNHNLKAEYIKYPIYDLAPSGVILNNYLRGENMHNLSPREAQIFYAKNRTQFEKILTDKLNEGINVVAEDYTGTGLAWGIGAGVNEMFLKYLNSHLLKEDLAFLFDGERFKEATEAGHKHETDDELMNKVRNAHLELGEEYGWIKINANLSIDEIHDYLWNEVLKSINFQTTDVLENNYKDIKKKTVSSSNILKVEKLSETAKIPTKALSQDAGLDLYADDYFTLLPGDVTGINTGIKMQIPDGYVGLIWDKSGVASQGLHTMGGVIDSNYRGEIKVLVKNLSNDIFNIVKGQKIAQILIQKVEAPVVVEKKIHDISERGDNGFGSTGLF